MDGTIQQMTDYTEKFNEEVKNTLHEAEKIFDERSAVYGLSHARHGNILNAFFPKGITLKSAEDFTRFMMFNAIIGKLNRYSENFSTGGHRDSVVDPINACAMLASFDKLHKENENEKSC